MQNGYALGLTLKQLPNLPRRAGHARDGAHAMRIAEHEQTRETEHKALLQMFSMHH